MLKQICFFMAILAFAHSAPVQGTFKELPCLGKHAGDRLPHPDDPHKFLRCVTADSAWIETCPDKLFYNPHSQICDWDTIEKVTTTTVATTVVRGDHAVLVKFRPRTDMVDGVVGRTGLEATVIQETELGSATPRGDTLLTIAPAKPIVPAAVVPSTSVVSVQSDASFVAAVTPALEIIQTTPRAEFVLPSMVESTTVAPIRMTTVSDLEVITVAATTTVPATEAIVVATTVAAPIVVAQSIEDQAALQKQQLQQRVAELQQELARVQQQVQPIVSATTPVARFNF